jgi:hypothetical protein
LSYRLLGVLICLLFLVSCERNDPYLIFLSAGKSGLIPVWKEQGGMWNELNVKAGGALLLESPEPLRARRQSVSSYEGPQIGWNDISWYEVSLKKNGKLVQGWVESVYVFQDSRGVIYHDKGLKDVFHLENDFFSRPAHNDLTSPLRVAGTVEFRRGFRSKSEFETQAEFDARVQAHDNRIRSRTSNDAIYFHLDQKIKSSYAIEDLSLTLRGFKPSVLTWESKILPEPNLLLFNRWHCPSRNDKAPWCFPNSEHYSLGYDVKSLAGNLNSSNFRYEGSEFKLLLKNVQPERARELSNTPIIGVLGLTKTADVKKDASDILFSDVELAYLFFYAPKLNAVLGSYLSEQYRASGLARDVKVRLLKRGLFDAYPDDQQDSVLTAAVSEAAVLGLLEVGDGGTPRMEEIFLQLLAADLKEKGICFYC